MSLFDKAVNLKVKLEAAQEADSNAELVTRGSRIAETLDSASEFFTQVATLRSAAQATNGPNLDIAAITQAIGAFRGGLARSGPFAFQYQAATNLTNVATKQRERAEKWVTAVWRDVFAPYGELLERAAQPLMGNALQVTKARGRAQTLQTAMKHDPIKEADVLRRTLGGSGVVDWLLRASEIADELAQALDALDSERETLSHAVKEALRIAGEGGLPLSELSDELLRELRNARLDQHLVVRNK